MAAGEPLGPQIARFNAELSGPGEKTLPANPGGHRDVPGFEMDCPQHFFARHLMKSA